MTTSEIVKKLQTAVHRHKAGDVATAARIYAEVLAEDPKNADAWHLSGLAEYAVGDIIHAESSIRSAIRLKPEEAEFKANLAAVLVNQQRSEEAEQLCRDVLRRDSGHVAALSHMGTALRQQRRLGESLEIFRRAAERQKDATALCNLGSILSDLGRVEEAIIVLLEARAMAPQLAQVHLNLGALQRESGDVDAALQSLATAERLMPGCFEVHVNRGNLFLERGQVYDAIEEFQQAIAIDSTVPSAVSGLGRALQTLGNWEESLEAQRLAAELDPSNQRYQSSYLYSVSLNPLLSRQEVFERHAQWGRDLETRIVSRTNHSNDRTPDRRLKIGYVSPDFRSHATMRFLYPFLVAHDRNAVEIFLYSETTRGDDVTQKVRNLADGWCDTRELSDASLAKRIQQDRIDILIDLAGHTAENRLPVFAGKPAPVQATFLGYPTTTGLSGIDYFLTDRVREPDGSEKFFTETLLRLPHGACCYQALEAPDVASPPCVRNGYVTLGSTHRLEKISPQTLDLWAQVMTRLPDARLLLFRDTLKSPGIRDHMRQTLLESGINTARVVFGWELPSPHLEVYSQIDILLDVFPWGSGTIAYDAMWMGVPIPTLPGDRGGCRATASMMHQCGFPELVAPTALDYPDLLVRLASDPNRLVFLRGKIRRAMARSVCNGDSFARDLEHAFRQMWRTYLDKFAQARQEQRS